MKYVRDVTDAVFKKTQIRQDRGKSMQQKFPPMWMMRDKSEARHSGPKVKQEFITLVRPCKITF